MSQLADLSSMGEPSIGGKVFTGLCLAAGLVTAVYQSHKQDKSTKKDQIGKRLDDYSYRDLFHFFINPEFHLDKLHLAKEFSERMHAEAAEYMKSDHDDNADFPDHFTYMKYDQEKVRERLDYIVERLFREKYLDWCDAGQPVTPDSRYWWAQTKVHLLTYLIQREPYHLTDGIWLRGVPQGPMSSIDSKLFAIYIDELGNGDISQNHCNVYLNVLKDLGLHVPSINSREFVDQQQILEISFQKPLLTLTTSLFPKTFQPEILGYTLWLETTSASEHASLRKILERYDLNPKFSLLHTAIDNNLNGHGRYARDAVEEYLEEIREKEGEQAVEEHWKRIWIGYVAYGTTGDIDKDLKELFEKQKQVTPREEFLQLIRKKRPLAQKMHGARRVGPNNCLLNQLFANDQAEKLCEELANSEMIVKGKPGESFLLNHAVTFDGPMYQVFNAEELAIISRWIISLAPSTVNDMLALLLKRRKAAENLSEQIQLTTPDGSEQTLKDLFQGNLSTLLAAIRSSKWNIPFDGSHLTEENVHTCPLMRSLEENGILAKIFDRFDEDREIVRKWLLDGSPLPQESTDNIQITSHQNFKFAL